MPDGEHTVRLLDDGPLAWRNAAGHTATQNQPIITDLSADTADYLVSEHPFEEVIDADVSAQTGSDDADGPSDESSQSTPNANAADAAAGAGGGNDEFDVDAYHEQGYQKRAEQVESGEVDAHLDEIYAAETSENVKEAIEARDAFDGGD